MNKILAWEKKKPAEGLFYPISREGHKLSFVDGIGIVMFGGFGAELLNEVAVYSIEDNKWKNQKTTGLQPSPRCYHAQFYTGKLPLKKSPVSVCICRARREGEISR